MMRRVQAVLSTMLVGWAMSPTPIQVWAASDGALRGAQAGTPVIARVHTMDTSWRRYHNKPAGYALDYPASWTIHEQTSADGSVTTTFTPPHEALGFSVTMWRGAVADDGSSDIPNTRCRPVMVAGLPGTRCFDTISFTTSTSVVAHGRTYYVSGAGKRQVAAIYDHVVRSFRLIL